LELNLLASSTSNLKFMYDLLQITDDYFCISKEKDTKMKVVYAIFKFWSNQNISLTEIKAASNINR